MIQRLETLIKTSKPSITTTYAELMTNTLTTPWTDQLLTSVQCIAIIFIFVWVDKELYVVPQLQSYLFKQIVSRTHNTWYSL